MDRRLFLATVGAAASAAGAGFLLRNPRLASDAGRERLDGKTLSQFVNPLPRLSASGGTMQTVITGAAEIVLHMREFQARVLPPDFVPAMGAYQGTWVWGYVVGPNPSRGPLDTYIGPVIVATRGQPTQVRYVNDLGDAAHSKVLAWVNATDQTLHWADPGKSEMESCSHHIVPGQPPRGVCGQHYMGPIPTVPHLHGGELPPSLDGGPDAWFTSDGLFHGNGYYSKSGSGANYAVYRYPNTLEAAPLWFHDHALGLTRLNVYAGLAGAYLLVDPANPPPSNLPAPSDVIPLVVQDRMFDKNGQLYFPNQGVNPEHPFWVPEFMGDVIVVNGKAWPYLELEARRRRFLVINGSNARAYEMFIGESDGGAPPMWQIGTDGGYLDHPVRIERLALMPGERADVIIDFAGFAGQILTLCNVGRTPYPNGEPPDGKTLGRILQFRVQQGAVRDTSFSPASGAALRSSPLVRLVDPIKGTLAAGVTVQKIRQLTLNELLSPSGQPLEVLLNNTEWDGKREDGSVRLDFTRVPRRGDDEYLSEIPNEGDTELWEIVNLTADAHPIHMHLTQVQLMNRQEFRVDAYKPVYEAAFPGGKFLRTFGPPLDYATGNRRALGGNPDVAPYLIDPVKPPHPNEAGWKDTVVAYPGEVMRIVVRFAPTSKPVNAPDLWYPFSPEDKEGRGYVWHCHIIDHEDNEMMRPFIVKAKPGAVRSLVMGRDY
jgi:FtsP/CotA-like multicopper oxidase with cupredoxin domain